MHKQLNTHTIQKHLSPRICCIFVHVCAAEKDTDRIEEEGSREGEMRGKKEPHLACREDMVPLSHR